jgi:hypothetical protein
MTLYNRKIVGAGGIKDSNQKQEKCLGTWN